MPSRRNFLQFCFSISFLVKNIVSSEGIYIKFRYQSFGSIWRKMSVLRIFKIEIQVYKILIAIWNESRIDQISIHNPARAFAIKKIKI